MVHNENYFSHKKQKWLMISYTGQGDTSIFVNPISCIVGFGQQQQPGTTVKFNPPAGQDTMVKNGVTQNINTKTSVYHCYERVREQESWG